MTRLTRLLDPVNPPYAHRFGLKSPRNLTAVIFSGESSVPIKPTTSPHTTKPSFPNQNFTSQTPNNRLKNPQSLSSMDSLENTFPESEISAPEDFVHVQNPSPKETEQNANTEHEISQNPNPNPIHSSLHVDGIDDSSRIFSENIASTVDSVSDDFSAATESDGFENCVQEHEISQNPNHNSIPSSPHVDGIEDSSRSFSENIASASTVDSVSDDSSAVTESEGFESSVQRVEEKKVLPEELSKSVVFLECESSAEGGSCVVYLVGTAHVSQESCIEVQAVISYLKPQVVFLELCSSRVAILTPQNLQVPTMSEMIDMWKKKKMNTFGILYSWFLAKVASKLEVLPGAEFRVAFEEAMSYGAKVILGDRPVQITLRRTWGKMKLWHKAKFLYYILFQAMFLPSPEDLNKMLKEMDDVDMLTLVIQEMSKEFPTMMQTLLHERDLYMSSTLLKVASEHASVVAVVGKGHLSGIKKHWKRPVEVKDLLELPAGNSGLSAMKILASVGVAATGVAIISGIYLAGKR
ncbi:uncharacterized protein LOC143884026 [Tasmannia lanceolata]|uniref:uncharacterized protein LOC143884026 n=1 Tax=Tasmannia lanceolata TaxID=3420 RepID=UPI0040635D7E